MAAGVMATTAALGFHVGLGADDGDAAAAVVPALHVAPGQRRRLGTPQSGVGQHDNQGQALRNSSGVGKGIYKSVVQCDREFLNVGVSDRQ